MEFLDGVIDFLAGVQWLRVVITIIATLLAVVGGIYLPARVLEAHTNQPLVRYAWYVVGTMALVMIYLAMYGYGQFWDLYRESEQRERNPALERADDNSR